jgi:tetratricopeptide (TPR) repeat protein
MNTIDYNFLLNKPNAISEKHSLYLDKIVSEFPYFQSARALQLKNLYNQDSFRYNQSLKVTAAHTTDRSVLFEFITSENFASIQKAFLDEKAARINEIIVNDWEVIDREIQNDLHGSKLKQSIITSIKAANPNSIIDESKDLEEKLAIGKPLFFSKDEKHSFQEWLQLSNFNPINRKQVTTNEIETILNPEKKRHLDLIDQFIKSNPKIKPVKDTPTIAIVAEQNAMDNSYLMTETLAKVYLEQKKYQKAIQAYEILILKYPEKISFFANRISDIKALQQNNT